ncbi:Cu(I)-responsive transcriptional regulator [Ferruginivarius sediminum]|uniref:Cu(I)-responsive transcriptional regulator n=1 Tax=Ferruginivarius sediminum TaxID=2661937 RepID=A0A369TB09_9PROT|nr:Cu(I)-responsive transcriptional regulator [Ferruginivarius sediminum]RDD62052.1 Cu(I)-responsive transcriptional regulator [Ferruginivarius sediminum]
MNIGEAASQSGLPPKTIRYYEGCGLLDAPARDENGYRRYSSADVHMLRFLQRARGLGFTMADCQELLDLYRDKRRSSADVQAVARRQLAEIDRKIAELRSMRHTLADLIERCHGDERPDCPIIDDLAGIAAPADAMEPRR